MILGQRIACCSVLALATLQSLYPATLLVPASIYLAQAERSSSLEDKQSLRASSCILTIVTFIAALLLLLYISSELAGGWEFLHATYGFMYVPNPDRATEAPLSDIFILLPLISQCEKLYRQIHQDSVFLIFMYDDQTDFCGMSATIPSNAIILHTVIRLSHLDIYYFLVVINSCTDFSKSLL